MKIKYYNGYSFFKEQVRFSRLTPLPQHGRPKSDMDFKFFAVFISQAIPTPPNGKDKAHRTLNSMGLNTL